MEVLLLVGHPPGARKFWTVGNNLLDINIQISVAV